MHMSTKPSWEEIKKEYITTNVSQRTLMKRYGVSKRQMNLRSKNEGWVAEKQAYIEQNKAKMQPLSPVEICVLADKLCEKTNMAIDNLDGDLCDAQRLRQLVQTVKDLKDIVKSGEARSDTGEWEELVRGFVQVGSEEEV